MFLCSEYAAGWRSKILRNVLLSMLKPPVRLRARNSKTLNCVAVLVGDFLACGLTMVMWRSFAADGVVVDAVTVVVTNVLPAG